MRIRLTPITWFVILALTAAALALGLAPDSHAVSQLHTSQTAYRLAVAGLLVPYIIIWYASFYAFAKLREYSKPLKNTKDGAAFHTITIGMGILAFSLVVPTIASLILNNIASHQPSFKSVAVIVSNYLGIFPGVAAFFFIYSGSRQLVHTVKGQISHFDLRWHAPWFLLLCVTFSHLTLENEYQSNPYHIYNVWLLIITVIVPYLYGWMAGLLGAYNLNLYAKAVNGLLYKKVVKQFAAGIAVTIIASITIQFVNVTIGQRISHTLGSVVLIDYILLIIIIIGLILMALAAKKLKSIEEL